MKKLYKEIISLILLFFLFNFLILGLQAIFTNKITFVHLTLFAILPVILGVSLVTEVIFSLIFSSFVVLGFATFLMFMIYTNKIMGLEQISYYMWFLVFPLGSFIGGSLRKKFLYLQCIIQKMEDSKEELALKNHLTLFKNKSTFLSTINGQLELYKRKKILFSAIMIEIQDFQLLKDTLTKEQLKSFYKYFASTLSSLIRTEEDIYFMGNGDFSIILSFADENELEGALKRLKASLIVSLLNPDPVLQMKKIPFKISGVTIDEGINNGIDLTAKLIKGLEFDV